MIPDIEAAVRAHPSVRAARETLNEAQARRDEVQAERDGIAARADEMEARLQAEKKKGDPDRVVRDLSRQLRGLRGELLDVSEDLEGQAEAVPGAVRTEARTILAEGMPAVWAEEDVAGVGKRVREALDALATALDELDALRGRHKALTDWGRHLVGRVLEGEAQAPALEEPTAGLSPADLEALSRVVRGVRITMEPEQVEENAA